jgi:hypothetical protein
VLAHFRDSTKGFDALPDSLNQSHETAEALFPLEVLEF